MIPRLRWKCSPQQSDSWASLAPTVQTPSWHPLKIKENIMLIPKTLLILAAKYFGAYILLLLVNLVTSAVLIIRSTKVDKFKSRAIKSLRQVPLSSSLVVFWGNVLNKYIWDTYQAVLLRSIFLPLPSAWLQQTWFLRPWPSTLNLRRTCEQKKKTRG